MVTRNLGPHLTHPLGSLLVTCSFQQSRKTAALGLAGRGCHASQKVPSLGSPLQPHHPRRTSSRQGVCKDLGRPQTQVAWGVRQGGPRMSKAQVPLLTQPPSSPDGDMGLHGGTCVPREKPQPPSSITGRAGTGPASFLLLVPGSAGGLGSRCVALK